MKLLFVIFFIGLSASAKNVSHLGNIIGGKCKADSDCKKICEEQTKDKGPGGLACGCLTDVKLCGFLFPKK